MKFRITNLDFFLDKPGELDHQHSQFGPTTQVPIIRIFGASEYGQKALIMVHKIYQYFYIKYSGTLEDADEYIRVLGNSINHAMGQLKSNGEKRTHLSKDLFIHSIKLVQGVDFYGFHSTYSLFLKISVINPHNVNKIVELFQNGVILNQRFNVFEHHIPYLFQFLLDYNLYGMDFIEFDRYVSKRIKEVPRKYPIDANVQLFNCENIMADSRKPISYCEMEIDIMNIWITNKDKMKERKFQPLKNELCEELLIPSLNHLWKDEEYRRQMHDLPPLQSNSSAYTRNDYVPWKNEYKFQEQIQEILLSKRAELIYSPHLNNKDRDENGIYRKVPTIFQLLHSTDVEKMIGDDDIDINKEKLSQLTCEILQEMYSSSEDEYMDEEYDELMNGIKSQVGSKNDLEDHSFLKPEECQLESEDIHVQGEEIVLPNNKIKQTLVVSPKTQLQTPQKVIQTLTDESPLFIDIPITIPNSVNALHKNSSIEDVIVPTSPVIIASNPSSQKSISPQTNMISRSSTETILPASPVVEASPNKSVRNSLFHPKAQRANSVSLSSLQLPKSPELSPVQSRKRKFGINETANKYPRLQVDETFAYELVIPQLDGAFELKKKKKHRKKEKSKSNFLNYKLFPIGNELDILNWPLECSKSICRLWSPAPNVDISKFAFFMDPPRPFSPSCPGIIRNNDWGGEMQQITPSVKAIKLNFNDEQNLEEIPEAQDVVPELDNVRMHKNSVGDFELQNETEKIFESADTFSNDSNLPNAFDKERKETFMSTGYRYFKYTPNPPSTSYLLSTLRLYDIPQVKHQKAFYSKELDVPEKPFKFAGKVFRIPYKGLDNLPFFNTADAVRSVWQSQQTQKGKLYKGITYYSNLYGADKSFSGNFAWTLPRNPISAHEAALWLQKDQKGLERPPVISQVEAPTLQNQHGFKYSSYNSMAEIKEKEFLCILNVEIHVKTRGKLMPDPQIDPVVAIFFTIYCEDIGRHIEGFTEDGYYSGSLVLNDQYAHQKLGIEGYRSILDDELLMFKTLIALTRHWDPDILTGYELQTGSWGYITRRCDVFYKFNFLEGLSRVVPEYSNSHYDRDNWGTKKNTSLHATGRIFLNIWRVMRKQLTLISYTFENIVFHVLHYRVPKYSIETLNEWYDKGSPFRWWTFKYYNEKSLNCIKLLYATEFITKTSEFARIYGIDFFSVITRGSQYKVEALMARITRPENYVMFSPNREQVASMRAPMVVPLNMEPLNEFYTDPLVVLDFTSLYPSQMIAYNYCYSTILGRVDSLGKQEKVGAMEDFYIPISVVEKFKEQLNIAPNGAVFVKPSVREGLLGRLLREILDTRGMVKSSMKLYKKLNGGIYRKLNVKQEGLKLVANVMYGYTAASFSGRMPCIEIADAIVSSARYTLERGIDMVNQSERWNSCVVYGDTDSLFVQMPNIPKELAFDFGYEIVNSVTRANPYPVKLKFEKVYFPSILLAKKRYVGFSFENKSDIEPTFDAKGIETVRRDGCPLVAKMVENCLKMLFRSKDLSMVKEYLIQQWQKILNGHVSIQDYIIAKEVKLGSYSKRGTLPAGAQISTKKIEQDPNAEPQYKERIPYVVVHKGPKHRLIDAVVSPEQLLNDQSLRIHGTYYITKQLMGPLSRIFNIVGADVERWYNEMPKAHKAITYVPTDSTGKKTIDHFYLSNHCLLCNTLAEDRICGGCMKNRPNAILQLENKVYLAEQRFKNIQSICRDCAGHNSLLDPEIACLSLDCPIYYDRVESIINVKNATAITTLLDTIDDNASLDW